MLMVVGRVVGGGCGWLDVCLVGRVLGWTCAWLECGW